MGFCNNDIDLLVTAIIRGEVTNLMHAQSFAFQHRLNFGPGVTVSEVLRLHRNIICLDKDTGVIHAAVVSGRHTHKESRRMLLSAIKSGEVHTVDLAFEFSLINKLDFGHGVGVFKVLSEMQREGEFTIGLDQGIIILPIKNKGE